MLNEAICSVCGAVRGDAGWWQWTWFELCVYFGDWDLAGTGAWSLEQ